MIRTIQMLLLASMVASCDPNFKVVVEYVNPAVTHEVQSSVQVIRSSTGRSSLKNEDAAASFIVRILDKDCVEMVFDLGEKEAPSFNIPIDTYFEYLCLETTYKDQRGFPFKVVYQPIYVEGPEILKVELPYDNQIFEFQDVERASHYVYKLVDRRFRTIQRNDKLFSSYIDFNSRLEIDEYSLVIHAVDSKRRNIKAIRVSIIVIPTSKTSEPIESILSLNLKFEKQQYQTRSVKRILIPESLLVGSEQLEVNRHVFNTKILRSYSGAFAALMNADDASMSGALSYTKNKASVFILGLSRRAEDVDVKLRDFNLFSVLGTSHHDSAYTKNGFESWVSPYSQSVVESGGHELATGFGVMIIQ